VLTLPTAPTVTSTNLPLPLFVRGKVRDVYRAGDALVIVATDRISAFDHVLPTPVPDKGRILTQLSAFWFERTRTIVPNHLISTDVARMPEVLGPHAGLLEGRTMLVRRARRLDVECVVRGYLAGSGWVDYRRDGAICGVTLPPGLSEGARLPEPIFTPATKASGGHDRNITYEDVVRIVGAPLATRLREASLALYDWARGHAERCGLLLADTKFEFGVVPGTTGEDVNGDSGKDAHEAARGDARRDAGDATAEEIILIDEALTPDSSRYWDAGAHAAGALVPFDKQFVRNYLLETGWDREPPAPALPPDVVAATRERYMETFRRLTGQEAA
jgi:phosphoribosylaminoimidazole-succinocarboxamide synthase